MTSKIRHVARILLFDEQNRCLLFLTKFPKDFNRPSRWITPGGGIEAGETPEQAAIRELFEETTLVVNSLGEAVAEDTYRVENSTGTIVSGIRTFFVHKTAAELVSLVNMAEQERADIEELRWWSLAELYSEKPNVQFDGLEQLIAMVSKNLD